MAVAELEWVGQFDFSAGAFPGMEHIPPNGVEDILNGIVDPDACLYRRGPTKYKTTSDSSSQLLGLWDGYLTPGQRTVVDGGSSVYMLGSDDQSLVQLLSGVSLGPTRWTQVSNLLIRPLAAPSALTLVVAGGARPFTALTAGTASVTRGSTTVSGVGTNWGGASRAGSVITFATGRPAAVKAAVNDTTLTLVDPYPYPTVSGGTYSLAAAATYVSPDSSVADVAYQSHVAQMFGRLILGNANRVSFTGFSTENGVPVPTLDFAGSIDFHLLPEGVVVTGLEPWRDTLLIFTTAGVWGLSGLAFDIVDAAGNPQHRLEPVARDVVLWGELGLAAWGGSLVIPSMSDVLVFDGGTPKPITGGAQRLYRSYVRLGYQPGKAVIYRSHYVLPILDQSFWPVDVLVWRLDMPGLPFSRWGGRGGRARSFAVRSGTDLRMPLLLATVDRRVEDFSDVFERSSGGPDSDGSMPDMQVVTRTLTAGTRARMWRRLRTRTEQDATSAEPVWRAEFAEGRPDNPFAALADATIREGR